MNHRHALPGSRSSHPSPPHLVRHGLATTMALLESRCFGLFQRDPAWRHHRARRSVMTRLRSSIVLAGLLALAACGGGSESATPTIAAPRVTAPEETTPDQPVPTSTESAPTTIAPTTTVTTTVDVPVRCGFTGTYEEAPCGEPHDAEFAGIVAIPDDPTDVSAMTVCAPLIEVLTDRPMTMFGVDVGFTQADEPDTLECWAEVSAEGTLSASIREVGLAAALGDFVLIADLDVGSCFLLADPDQEAVDIALASTCDAEGAQLLFGRFDADDGPPPDEATRDGFATRCEELDADSQYSLGDDADGWYFISAEPEHWEAVGRRAVLCVMELAWLNTDPSGTSGPVCAVYDSDLQDYPIVPCDEPHNAQYAGSVAPPPGNLPDDVDSATILLYQLCREKVETLTGRSLALFGSGIGFVIESGLGEPMVDDVRCYASVSLEGIFTAAISEVGYQEALAHEIVADLEPGTCFTFVGDSYGFADESQCDAPNALMAIGVFAVEDPPGSPYPGEDALRSVRAERCTAILDESELTGPIAVSSGVVEVDLASLSGTIPNEVNWLSHDLRQITCDAALTGA